MQIAIAITTTVWLVGIFMKLAEIIDQTESRKERRERFNEMKSNKSVSEFLLEARRHDYEEWIKKPTMKPQLIELTEEQQASWNGVFELFTEGKL